MTDSRQRTANRKMLHCFGQECGFLYKRRMVIFLGSCVSMLRSVSFVF